MDPGLLVRLTAVAAGGACGAVARYLITIAAQVLLGSSFAYGVLVANVLGCFVLGILMHTSVLVSENISATLHIGITVGVLGALTTFSTFGYDTLSYFEQQKYLLAAANIVGNLVLGISACWLGKQTAGWLW